MDLQVWKGNKNLKIKRQVLLFNELHKIAYFSVCLEEVFKNNFMFLTMKYKLVFNSWKHKIECFLIIYFSFF